MKSGRRRFLHIVPIAVAGLALGTRAQAQAKLDPNDPQAKALGYVEDAKKADKAKFSNWKAGEECDDCIQFKGKEGDASGPCQIFGNKAVAGKGWCSAWQKKA